MVYVSYLLSFAAIIVMARNVILALRLKRAIIGGEIGEKWGLLTNLILVFLAGYILSPLLLVLNIPVEVMAVVVFAVFLFGAVFVMVVIGIIKDTLTVLNVLKDR